MDILRAPLFAIESVAFAAINLIGTAFSSKYTLKHAFGNIDKALQGIVYIPVCLMMAPVKLAFQIFSGVVSPENARPFTWR